MKRDDNSLNYDILVSRQRSKNKIDPLSPVSLLQLQSVVVHSNSNSRPSLDNDNNDKGEICDSTSSSSSGQFEVLLLNFFKISYFLGIMPYYVSVNAVKDDRYKVNTVPSGKLHTAFVVLVHSCTALRCVMLFTLLSYDLKNPLNYFEIARTTLSATLCWFFIWTLWMKHGICKKILHCLANLNYFPNVTVFKLQWIEQTVTGICLILLYATSVYPAIQECNARISKFCENDQHWSETSFCQHHKNGWNWDYEYGELVTKVLFVIFNFIGHTTRRYPRMKLLVVSITLWQVCKSFGTSLRESRRRKQRKGQYYNSHEISSVLKAYEELKEITNLIRKLVGKMLVTEIVEDILYFSLEVQLRLRKADWFSTFVVFETWLVAFLAYYTAACAAEPVQQVSKWLARDDVLSQLPPGKVSTLHTQLNDNPIGLKGGNLFTITKSFLANVVTVWLTYFIILLQFQSTLGSNNG